MPNPKLIPQAFCSNGLKNDIPETRTSGIAENAVTYNDGFPQITMTPVVAGGKPPSGKDMNGILHEISEHIVHLNKGGMYQFDATFANKIGGYPKGAVLVANNLDALFLSLVDKNKTNFNSASYNGKWLKFSNPIINNLTTNDAEKPLSAAMGKKLHDEKLGKEGSQEINGATLTLGGQTYTGYRLWSRSGNEGLLIETNGSNSGHKIMVRRHNNGTFETGNIRSFALPAVNGDYTLAPAGLLTTQNLNTVTTAGLYGQNSNSNAQTQRNYPIAKAGSLMVLPSAYGVQQIYSVFDGTDIYARNQTGSGWGAWAKTNVSHAEMQSAIAAAKTEIVNGSPAALDTIKELAQALGNDANFANKVLQQIAGKANKATTRAGYGITDASQVAVISGQVNHGGTIPLPAGYSAAQCKWLVSMAQDDVSMSAWDVPENGSHHHYYIRCFANDARVVTAQAYHGWDNSNPRDGNNGWKNGKANYICIGVK